MHKTLLEHRRRVLTTHEREKGRLHGRGDILNAEPSYFDCSQPRARTSWGGDQVKNKESNS